MGGVVKQVTLVKSSTARTDGQDVEQLRAIGGSLALLDGTTKPVIANAAVPFADLTAAANAFNSLLTALRTRGVIS